MKILIDKIKKWYSERPCKCTIGPGHNYVGLNGGRWFEQFENTGQYIDGKPIQRKYELKTEKCTRCGDINNITHYY